jgi:hypothetical protein
MEFFAAGASAGRAERGTGDAESRGAERAREGTGDCSRAAPLQKSQPEEASVMPPMSPPTTTPMAGPPITAAHQGQEPEGSLSVVGRL